MDTQDTLSRQTILAALARLDVLLREKGIIGEVCIYDSKAVCDLVCQYYSERLLAPKVRFFIEEIIEEIRP